MPRYFAQLDIDNVVQQVIVADSLEWCTNNLGGVWTETFPDRADKNYAGIGYTYHSEKENFSQPQPYSSWSLTADCKWEAPVAKPEGEYKWDEKNQEWTSMSK